jgi:cell division protein FtsZ
MQSSSHDNAFQHEHIPQQWVMNVGNADKAGKADARPDVYEEQEDQWAVLRHEVEVEQMQGQNEKIRSGWEQRDTRNPGDAGDQRDTGDDTVSRSSPFDVIDQSPQQVDIVVAGVGGGGMNAINRMMEARVRGVRFVAMNTDAQVLSLSSAPQRICLGQHYTKGLGAGGNAAVGMRAATESAAEIRAALGDADLVFIAAGMGGGTGTGAAPVVASIAKKLGALTVGIVTLPFTFEGTRRKRIALEGLDELSEEIDALITVPNDRLLTTTGRDRSLNDAFRLADDVLRQGVQGIAEVINVPGMVNVDFADVRSVLREAGTALMSIGQGRGRNRAQMAADEAVAGGFLNVTIRGAKRVLFNISGGDDMSLFEVNEVAERIGLAIDDTADITFGAVIDPSLKDTIRVTLIAAGMEERSTLRIPAIHVEQQVEQRPTAPRVPPVVPNAPAAPVTPRPAYPASMRQQPPALSVQQPQRGQPEQSGQPTQRPSGPPGRQQRSLEDLRGIRGMGRRYEAPNNDADDIDIPPFLKRPQQT